MLEIQNLQVCFEAKELEIYMNAASFKNVPES